LKFNDTLQSLYLSGNHIGDKGLEYLSDGLKENQSLKTLSLVYNGITSNGKVLFLDCLRINSSLLNCETVAFMR
jgi:Ran GTPase-activating protein (RanGAP) involved in mRNA processing and transport